MTAKTGKPFIKVCFWGIARSIIVIKGRTCRLQLKVLFWVPKGPGVIVVRQWLTENGMAARVVGCAHACGFSSRGVKLSFNISLQVLRTRCANGCKRAWECIPKLDPTRSLISWNFNHQILSICVKRTLFRTQIVPVLWIITLVIPLCLSILYKKQTYYIQSGQSIHYTTKWF